MEITKPTGKLGVLIPGMGAVASTFIAGVEAIKQNLAKPIGSMTQMGTIRLGKRTEDRVPLVKEFIPIEDLENLVFAGWDINRENLYEIGIRTGVLEKQLLDTLKHKLEQIEVLKGVFVKKYVRRLDGKYVKSGKNKMDLAKKKGNKRDPPSSHPDTLVVGCRKLAHP